MQYHHNKLRKDLRKSSTAIPCVAVHRTPIQIQTSPQQLPPVHEDLKLKICADLHSGAGAHLRDYIASNYHGRIPTMSTSTRKGSCLCGKIQYEVRLPSSPTVHFCYCTHCRKSSASLLDAFLVLPRPDLIITRGKENLTDYSIKGDSGYPVIRVFCKDCGSRIYGYCTTPKDEAMFEGSGALTMGIGTLDVDTQELDKWTKGESFYEKQRCLIHI